MTRRGLRPGTPGAGGYRRLAPGAATDHLTRTELAPEPSSLGESLVTIAHLSDIHVCDAQSPARVEYLDRWGDPDSPVADQVGEVGTYRPQEFLTVQVAEAMVQAVNAVSAGPVGGAPLDFAIATGDNTDNAQRNELAWYLTLLEGGPVQPDSGDLTRYEGIADDDMPDERFWHPHGGQPDLARSQHGFPVVPGLLDAVRAPFDATGLLLPWLAVHGNHDRLLQGTVPAIDVLAEIVVGPAKAIGLPEHWSAEAAATLFAGLNACDPEAIGVLATVRSRAVAADLGRGIFSREEFVAAHFGPRARPSGHGFTSSRDTFYRHDHGPVTVLVLDTVNHNGGFDGALDRAQFEWLQAELTAADAEHRYVILASHHPLGLLVNGFDPGGATPWVLAGEVAAELSGHPSLVLWLNGHTHQTTVAAHDTWWEVTAPSLIDWPQQGRVVEVLRGPGGITIAATMLDHAGPAPWDGAIDAPVALAGLSRELAANDWKARSFGLDDHPRGGRPSDRDVLLHLPDPWPVRG